jgi:cell division protein FtsL
VAGAAATRTNHTLRAVWDGARSEAVARRTRPEPLRAPARVPRLIVVPRRRRTARLAAAAFTIVFLLMLGVVAFQTQLAQNQLELDRTEQKLDLERSRTRDLRRESAVLRAPERIAAEAQKLGLVPTSSRDFLVIPADVFALVDVAAGDALDDVMTRESDAFRDYQETKQLVTGEVP